MPTALLSLACASSSLLPLLPSLPLCGNPIRVDLCASVVKYPPKVQSQRLGVWFSSVKSVKSVVKGFLGPRTTTRTRTSTIPEGGNLWPSPNLWGRIRVDSRNSRHKAVLYYLSWLLFKLVLRRLPVVRKFVGIRVHWRLKDIRIRQSGRPAFARKLPPSLGSYGETSRRGRQSVRARCGVRRRGSTALPGIETP